jgi:hypothetical protein
LKKIDNVRDPFAYARDTDLVGIDDCKRSLFIRITVGSGFIIKKLVE